MSLELSFSSLLTMVQDETGLVVPVSLMAGKQELDVDAYLDTGAKYCVFPRWIGTSLGIDVESGEEISLGTGGGPLVCYLHYLTLRIGSLYFDVVPICFTKFDSFPRCLLGREGWLQKVKIGIVTYEDQLYLGVYDE